jgi:hypothetical protein
MCPASRIDPSKAIANDETQHTSDRNSNPNSNLNDLLDEIEALFEHLERTIAVTDHMITAKQIMWDRNYSDDDRVRNHEYAQWAEATVRPTMESVRNAKDYRQLLEAYPEVFHEYLNDLRCRLLELEEEDKYWQDAYDERF